MKEDIRGYSLESRISQIGILNHPETVPEVTQQILAESGLIFSSCDLVFRWPLIRFLDIRRTTESNRTWDPGGKNDGRHASPSILNSRSSFSKKGSLM
jgi:hypothetical protein